jgi:hypothetical protein
MHARRSGGRSDVLPTGDQQRRSSGWDVSRQHCRFYLISTAVLFMALIMPI